MLSILMMSEKHHDERWWFNFLAKWWWFNFLAISWSNCPQSLYITGRLFLSSCYCFLAITKRLITNLDIKLIIIISCYHHRYPWPSLATPPYHPLLPVGLQGYIPYRHWAAVCMFELVVLSLLVHVKRFIEECHLWARPYFSGLSNFDIFRDGS